MPASFLSGNYGGQIIKNVKDMVLQIYINGYNAKDNQQILEESMRNSIRQTTQGMTKEWETDYKIVILDSLRGLTTTDI
jgi:hypothetical protein